MFSTGRIPRVCAGIYISNPKCKTDSRPQQMVCIASRYEVSPSARVTRECLFYIAPYIGFRINYLDCDIGKSTESTVSTEPTEYYNTASSL